MSQSDVEEKHVIKDKAVSQEDISRPSSSIHDEFNQQNETVQNHEPVEDKEAQIDARSTMTTESAIPPPPDGGLHAWLKVFGGFMIYINIWGFTLTYGAFQTYYRTTLLPSSSPSAISWIGTVQAWLLIVIGVLSGPLFDLGYFRSMLLVGNVLVVLGIMMLSLSTKYWQVFLSQGLCGVIYIIMFDHLVRTAGFPWTIRAIGFVALAAALLSIPALLSGSAWLKHKRKRRALFDKTALHDRLFLIFTACSFSTFLGYIVPYFYIPTYARERLGSNESTALYMLVLAIAGSFFGRLVSGVLAHFLGAIVTWALCAFSSGVLALCWISIETEKTFIAFSILWASWILADSGSGFFSAALVTVPSAAFANITPDLSRLGTRLGMSWSVSSIASLIGAPIAGALLKKTNGRTNFVGVQVWSGVCLMLGTCWLVVLWIVTVRTQKKGWRV
ncbi:unnamed protein product [Alternaria sp. RS040]